MRLELPFTGQSYRHRTLPLSAQTTRNWYPEINQQTRAVVSLQPTPGLKSFCAADNVYTTVTGSTRPADFWANIWGKTVITVGPSGRDYTTIQSAYNAIVAGTHGASTDEYVVLLDDGSYGALATSGGSGRNIIWKSWGGASACTISTTKPNIDLRGGADVVFEGITLTCSSNGFNAYINSTAGSLTFSKCIINCNTRSGQLTPTSSGNTVTVTYENTYSNTTSPQVDNHEFTGDGTTCTMSLVLTNSRLTVNGAISGASGLTISTSGSSDSTLTSAVATNTANADSLPFAYYVRNKEYDRGLNVWNGKLYSVSGNTLYEVSRTGERTSKGTIDGSQRCYFANESTHFIIVTGGLVYLYNGAVSSVFDNDLESPQTVCYLNRQAIFDGKNGRFWVSDVNKLNQIEPFNFASAEGSPDDLLRVYSYEQTLYLFGSSTVEIWYNSGVGNPPFDRIEGGIIDVGLAARGAVANTQSFIYFLGDDLNVYQMSRGSVRPISNPAMAHELNGLNVSDAFGFCYTFSGQEFFQITFPSADRTYCFSEASGQWFDLSSDMRGGRHIGNSYAFCYGKHLVGDYRNGNIYHFDPDTFTDNGEAVRRVRDTITIDGAMIGPQGIGRKVFMRSFELILNSGCGIETGQGSAPEVMMQFSDDGGRTWSPELWRSLGPLGSYDLKVNWHNLGAFNQRIMRVAVSDPVGLAILRASVDLEVGW